jgi:glycosyltransferase involved in cell wall biosynthesis
MALAISQDTADALVRATGIAPERVRLLPPAVDPSLEDAAPASPEPPEGLDLLTVARLSAEEGRKGVEHALRAFARLAPRYPRARYRIVGTGTDRGRLEALARSLDLDGRVVLESGLSDAELAARYRGCALFVLPSGQEGAGIAFLEAMRFGRPCIGARAGGTPELIDHGRTGLLVPYGDETAIEAALASLLDDAALRQRLGAAGRERALADFSFERFRDRLRGHLDWWLGQP